jgi:hypothetical protein
MNTERSPQSHESPEKDQGDGCKHSVIQLCTRKAGCDGVNALISRAAKGNKWEKKLLEGVENGGYREWVQSDH